MSRVLPILFNTEMVRAILEDRKKATRRLIKKSQCVLLEKKEPSELEREGLYAPFDGMTDVELIASTYKPQYQPGDILYVRETWNGIRFGNGVKVPFRTEYWYKADDTAQNPDDKWRPNIHMPKEAARIWLRVTDVRVERLHDMTLDDFLNEGVVIRPEAFNDPENAYQQAKNAFINIWDSTVKKTERDLYGWDADPYVLVTEFERCEKP